MRTKQEIFISADPDWKIKTVSGSVPYIDWLQEKVDTWPKFRGAELYHHDGLVSLLAYPAD